MTTLSRLRGLFRNERGTSVIELAIVAPFLTLVTMGIIDLSTGYARRLALTEAVDRTIEKISARNFVIPGTAAAPDFTIYRQDAAQAAGVPIGDVSVSRWLECDGVEQPSFEGTCAKRNAPECDVVTPPASADCFPIMARYVQVSIDSSFRPMFARIVAPGPDGTYPLSAEAAVRIQ